MKRRLSLVSIASVAALLLPINLRGAKPPADQPAIVTFRCAASGSTDCPGNVVLPDGIRGDGASYAAVLNSNRELGLSLQAGAGRTAWLDFRNGPPLCWGCRRDFDTLYLDDVLVQTNVVDAVGAEVANGLLSIPVGSWSDARLKIAFNRLNSSGQTILWAVRFNPETYPGSDHVTARRISTNTWEVEATSNNRALLISSILRKNGSQQQEGEFYMPFKMTVVSPTP